ncbi:hypothetical protein FQR65_LT14476 [Abscondita terminalis]|nr:hypothetical protein FQR65_LT14476 [Abscondita terminalis]
MTSNSTLYVLGAAVVGIVSAAGLFIAEHFRQERRRHALVQDLARLDRQLSGMQKELEQLRSLQLSRKHAKTKRLRNEASKNTSIASNYSSDFESTLEADSSDLEFYDLSDEENSKSVTPLQQIFKEVDDQLNVADAKVIEAAFERLLNLNEEFPRNSQVLWRLGKAYHKMSSTVDDTLKQDYIGKGVDACQDALNIDDKIAEAHKWFAILIGLRSGFQSIQGKISDGYLFKQHIDAAIAINPDDATLHHMLGRFTYESANLKWYERKVAATFFAEPPNGTFDEALEQFLVAERLMNKDWKENKLLIAKCQIALGRYHEAIETLRTADSMLNDSLDTTIDSEVKVLLQKYNTYG